MKRPENIVSKKAGEGRKTFTKFPEKEEPNCEKHVKIRFRGIFIYLFANLGAVPPRAEAVLGDLLYLILI